MKKTQPIKLAKPWHNHHPLSVQRVLVLIHQHFPEITVQSVQKLGEGWDNTTWLVNHTWVFRFPKHNLAAKLLNNELKTLNHLPDLGVGIPKPQWIGQSSENFPYPFYGHVYLSGITAEKAVLSHTARGDLAGVLGKFLRQLHDFPVSTAQTLEINADQIGRATVSHCYPIAQERFAYLLKHQLITPPLASLYLSYFKHYQYIQPSDTLVLGHGDLYAKHLVLNTDNQLSAIIDWGDCELIHPSIDIALVYQFIPSEYHSAFWREYDTGNVSEETKILAKIRAIYSAVNIVWFAHEIRDQYLLTEGLYGLDLLKIII